MDSSKALIDLRSIPIQVTLKTLLQDKTTKKNIIWATMSYEEYGPEFKDDRPITANALLGLNPMVLQPRVLKSMEEQQARTKSKAEVFTPSWLCNKMNNYLDEDWFGRKDVFNKEVENSWVTNENQIQFPKKKAWKKYIASNRLEITCGEAPYLVSRYDTSTGELIVPPNHRIGLLDRKLRIINENVDDEQGWYSWVIKAYQSIYGYEYQGDNLLIGRINLLMTFVDNYESKWNKQPDKKQLRKIANIIAWNLWQMDGLTGTVPLGVPQGEFEQPSLFDLFEDTEKEEPKKSPKCKIYDWRIDNSILFESLKRDRR